MRAHSLLVHGKYRRRAIKREWNGYEYHVQEIKDVQHISAKISCATTQFPVFSFFSPHAKPHGMRGLSKHCH